MELDATSQFAALSHPQRLAIFKLLMRRLPDSVPAGEISDILRLKPSTTSVYLSALRDAALIAVKRIGTSLHYSANIETAENLIQFLTSDCCRDRPELCLNAPIARSSEKKRKFNVLFICTGNSARSILAESILRAEAGDRFNAYSAGSRPRGTPNLYAIEMLKGKDIPTATLRSKSIAEFQSEDAPEMDFVFTVCDLAANEDCPAWRGQPISAHWSMPDPLDTTGTTAEKKLAFHQTFGALHNRIKAFAALPLETLDRSSLQSHVDRIGKHLEKT